MLNFKERLLASMPKKGENMSYGERSCKKYQDRKKPCGHHPTFRTCNHLCDGYIWDGETQTELERASSLTEAKPSEDKKPLKFSDLSKSQRRKFRKKGYL